MKVRKFWEGVVALAIIAGVDLWVSESAQERFRLKLWADLQRWKFDNWVAMGRHGLPPQIEPYDVWKRSR